MCSCCASSQSCMPADARLTSAFPHRATTLGGRPNISAMCLTTRSKVPSDRSTQATIIAWVGRAVNFPDSIEHAAAVDAIPRLVDHVIGLAVEVAVCLGIL